MRSATAGLLVGTLLAATAGAEVITPRIVNGVLTAQYPSAGALLGGSDPDAAGLGCSGTLIGCRTFLTAAHCVCDGPGLDCQPGGPLEPDPARFHVFLQHAGVIAVTAIDVRADFDFPVGDVALLHLARPVTGVAPTPPNRTASPATGTAGLLVGFGRTGGGGDYGLKRAGAVTTAPCVGGISDETSVCWNFEDPLGPPGDDANTCNGDSGGPLLIDFGCGPTVAGITSGGVASDCLPLDHSYDADVHHYRAWIDAYGGADVTMTSCGDMPQAGEAGAPITAFTGDLEVAATGATHAVNVPAGTAALRVALNALDDGSADFDLYVRAGAPPTTSTWDCRRVGSGQFAACEFADPVPGPWWVLVHRYAGEGAYQVTATTFAAGSPGPGSEGWACDDRNACTGGDACHAGTCAGVPVADGTPCDDGRGCTQPDACSAGTCRGGAGPRPGCRLPGTAVFQLRDGSSDDGDRLTWKWTRGAATAIGDFGDPTASTPYELCVFDVQAGVPSLVADLAIPPGAAWSGFSRGFRYRDRSLAQAGVASVLLKAGAAGAAAVALKAKGTALLLPALPLAQDPAVVVQLRNDTVCWEAGFATSLANDATTFKARSD